MNFKLQYILLLNNVHLLVKLILFYAMQEYYLVYQRTELFENSILLLNFDAIVVTL